MIAAINQVSSPLRSSAALPTQVVGFFITGARFQNVHAKHFGRSSTVNSTINNRLFA